MAESTSLTELQPFQGQDLECTSGPRAREYAAMHFLRLVHRADVGQRFGANAVAMLVTAFVARGSFSSPAEFSNAAMSTACGCIEETMIAVRKKLIQAGLLRYVKGAKRRPGVYWVVEPNEIKNATGIEPVRGSNKKDLPSVTHASDQSP